MPLSMSAASESVRKLHTEYVYVTIVTALHSVPERGNGSIGGFIQGGIIHENMRIADIHAAGRCEPVIRA